MDTPVSQNVKGAWSPPLPEGQGFEHSIVETPGLRTHVATSGAGEPVVMLHGFPEHWWQWRRIGPVLATHGYRVICPDLRGSGWTEAEHPGFRRDSMLRDLVALLDAMAIERAFVVSHDLGAVVAGQLGYEHPERVRAAVQLSVPPGFMTFTPRLLPAFKHMPPMLLHREGQSIEWLFGPEYALRRMPRDVLDGYLRVQRRPEVSRAVSALYRGMIVPEVLRLARGAYRRKRLRPPTLAVFGRQDGPFTEPVVRRICRDHERRADRFELAFIDGAAHFITDDAPDAVAEVVLEWFDREQ